MLLLDKCGFSILGLSGLQLLTPGIADEVFQDWWKAAEARVCKEKKKGFNSLVALSSWRIWKHRNACVFDGVPPSVSKVIQDIKEEARIWCLAGAAGMVLKAIRQDKALDHRLDTYLFQYRHLSVQSKVAVAPILRPTSN